MHDIAAVLKFKGILSKLLLLLLIFLVINSPLIADEVYRLPPIPKEKNNQNLASIEKIKVIEFIFEGNTVFSDEQLKKITDPFLHQFLSIEQLVEIKHLLTKFYVDKGYINSGAILADQKVQAGAIQYNIVEGRLTEIKIHGNQGISTDYLSAKLEQFNQTKEGTALNLFALQKNLKLLEQSTLIETIDAQLNPGLRPGQSQLDISVKEAKPYRLSLKMDNHRSPSIGAERALVEFNHNNLFGYGERLFFSYGFADDKDDYLLSYSMPLDANKTRAGISIERDSSSVLTEPFNSLGFSSELRRFSTHLSHRFVHKLDEEITAGVQHSLTRSDTQLLGEPFAFPPGVAEARVNELSFYVNWVKRDSKQVFAARGELGFGLPGLNSTERDHDLPDGRFIRWTGQLQWLQSLPFWSAESLFRLNMQLSNDNLLSMNQFAVGGANTVRGYRENTLVRDNGVVASIEAHIPIAQFSIPGLTESSLDSRLKIVPFFDYAYVWNHDDFLFDPEQIYSVGLGLEWKVDRRLSAEIYWGKDLKKTQLEHDSNIQDKGIHLQFVLHML